jgi:hypothetical protein
MSSLFDILATLRHSWAVLRAVSGSRFTLGTASMLHAIVKSLFGE